MADQLTFDLDSPLVGKVKNDRNTMVFNFFSLSKERVTKLPVYDDGQVRIEVNGTEKGVATIWDKEILIYLASIIQDKMNRGEEVGRRITFTAHDLFRITGTKPTGGAYDRLLEGLERLQGTQIKTNIETGGEGEDGAFSWITDYKVRYRRASADGEKVMKAITIEICDWLFRAILRDGKMLTYDPGYFKLPPIEKRLYEIARAHCGNQKGFRIGLEKLYSRVGTDNDLRRFKSTLVSMGKKSRPLPEYGMMVIDPRRFGLDRKAPPPTGRTPLKAYQVYFFRTNNLSGMLLPEQAPVVDDEPMTAPGTD